MEEIPKKWEMLGDTYIYRIIRPKWVKRNIHSHLQSHTHTLTHIAIWQENYLLSFDHCYVFVFVFCQHFLHWQDDFFHTKNKLDENERMSETAFILSFLVSTLTEHEFEVNDFNLIIRIIRWENCIFFAPYCRRIHINTLLHHNSERDDA